MSPVSFSHYQRGVALPVALLFLLLVTVMAVAGAWYGVSEERMASAQRQSSLALAGAETAVRAGERWLYNYYKTAQGTALVGQADGSTGVYSADALASNTNLQAFMQGARWATTGATAVPATDISMATAPQASQKLATQPVYIIEDLGPLRPAGAGIPSEGGLTGTTGYGTGGETPAGNADLHVYRITGKSQGQNANMVRTVQSTYAGRVKD